MFENENQHTSRYFNGLKPLVRDKIGVQVVLSVQEIRNLALKVELLLAKMPRNENYKQYNGVDNRPTANKGKSVASSSNVVDVGEKGVASGGNMSKGNTTN